MNGKNEKGNGKFENQEPLEIKVRNVCFELGGTFSTPGAIAALEEAGETGLTYLARHHSGDWGDVSKRDKKENELSLKKGFRIVSVYKLPNTGEKIWIITEADRSSTTILLPSEY
jgi:hypothetical protein